MKQEKKPSRFHEYSVRKQGWKLNNGHPDLKSTSTCEIFGTHYCAYCGERALPIQAKLHASNTDNPYLITGNTCDCPKARLERALRDEEAEFERKVNLERQALGCISQDECRRCSSGISDTIEVSEFVRW